MRNIPVGFRIIGLRARYRFVCLFFAANGMAIIFLSLYISALFLIALPILLLVCGFYAINLKCPVCGKPVLLNPVNNLGIEMYVYTPAIPPHCSKCGSDLV
jgi:rRNA maturation protein Nop10